MLARPRGFTIVELMIGLALIALLLMLGVPAFNTMLQNMKLRSAAESIQTGLQTARVEALRRNQRVELLLTDSDVGSFASAAANTTGPNWIVRVQDPSGLGWTLIEGKSSREGAAQSASQAVSTVISLSGTNAPPGNIFRFDGMGRVSNLGGTSSIDISNPGGGACVHTDATNGKMRCLRILVTPAGRIRMCDPAVATGAGDTRACE